MSDVPGFDITIPGLLAGELRTEIRAGRMTFAQFDYRLAAELGRTGPKPLIEFLYETFREED